LSRIVNGRRRPAALCYDPVMIALLVATVLSSSSGMADAAPLGSAPATHFEVSAEFHPGKVAGAGEVAVTFAPKDPDVKVNTTPAPRLKLDAGQKVLADKPAVRKAAPEEKYLDPTFPVVFPVAVLGGKHGAETVKGEVTYFYCSHREGWCRKGTADVDIAVKR
jgi:hypothetical protein